ncbi:DUF4112 domain-containing protein [Teichococcus aestuarii]|uniref:DUF4112 domain-containing protein n=1 Tax=Teichococcus aestuarii TaxID=568898 RepID=A0A2U1V6U1_9PROT|nr:DUF4112 domain-containing protein [Pseudoroseomonas aestuarii]PWC29603.1 hypothetical protein CR165_06580 [Pseudoroseomonas aestuarii]
MPPRTDADTDATRRRLEAVARLLDSRWRLPLTNIRFGADPVLNLVPGLGLLASKGVSVYLLWEARRLGVPLPTLLRMLGHLGLDTLISAVPVVGWAGDVFYRANLRNMRLLREHLDRPLDSPPLDMPSPDRPSSRRLPPG